MTQTKFKKVPFNLELAKKITNNEVKGRIVTKDGLQARIVCFDFKHCGSKNNIIAIIDCGDYEFAQKYDSNGKVQVMQDMYDLFLEIPIYYRDYSNFIPQKWQPCLVRENEDEIWLLQVSKGKRCDDGVLFYCPDGSTNVWRHCLPFSKATKHLLGTNKSYEEMIK